MTTPPDKPQRCRPRFSVRTLFAATSVVAINAAGIATLGHEWLCFGLLINVGLIYLFGYERTAATNMVVLLVLEALTVFMPWPR